MRLITLIQPCSKQFVLGRAFIVEQMWEADLKLCFKHIRGPYTRRIESVIRLTRNIE
jgi:hypothetical protein